VNYHRHIISINKGFSLVEIMVGLAIGMLATLVIMQVLNSFQTQQRRTTGNTDAQTSGGLAMYLLQRELQLGGYGLPVFDTTNPALGCSTVTDSTTGNPMDISPVSIIDGGTGPGGSDQIIVRYGDAQTGGINARSVTFTGTTQVAFTTYFAPYLYASGPNNCPITASDCPAPQLVMVASGGTCTISPVSNSSAIAVTSSASLAYLGSWNTVTFAVNNGQLERNGIAIGPSVVSMQAQYGISAVATSNVVTQWVDATGATWGSPAIADRNRIKAVRIAIVARNDKPEGSDVTAACSSLTAANPTGLCAWEGTATSPAPEISLAAADWQRYRYRVFETIIPLRNVIWSRNTL
jgi:type IV pilus assembly protein PilW